MTTRGGILSRYGLFLLLACTAISLQLFILNPLTIYLGNVDQFLTQPQAHAGFFVKLALAAFAVLFLAGLLTRRKVTKHYLTSLFAIHVLIWAQSSLLVWDFGRLDGKSIDWSAFPERHAIDIAVWVSIIITFALLRHHLRAFARFSTLVLALQFAGVAYTYHDLSVEIAAKQAGTVRPSLPEQIFGFSGKNDVLHIIADGFQTDIFEDIVLGQDANGLLHDRFEGFTVFMDNAGAYPLTHMTIPAIFSGLAYVNDAPRATFMDTALGRSSFIGNFKSAGYEIDVIVPAALNRIYKRLPNDHFYPVSANYHTDSNSDLLETLRIFDIALFRALPTPLKGLVYNDQRWILQSLLSGQATSGLQVFAHNAFLSDLSSNVSRTRDKPVYKIVHLMLSHEPMVLTSSCTYAGSVLPTVRTNVTNQARCSLLNVMQLFKSLKDKGLYDSTTIILMGDHGAYVPPKRFPLQDDDARPGSINNPFLVAMATPLLAIKPARSRTPLKVSTAPTSILDTAATVTDLMGIDREGPGSSVFSLAPSVKRVRRYYSYQYKRSEWTDDYLSPIQEYRIHGNVLNPASWVPSNQYHPQGRVISRSPAQ
jgi:hypothetical protein